MKGFKRTNHYSHQVRGYDHIPKAVFAAIAVSALTQGGDYLEEANERLFEEWQILHDNGIVPQKPKKF